MHYLRFYSFLIVIGITLLSCSKDDYEAQVPTYISIDQITLTTNLSTEGSASSNITDAWVFINDDLVGVYELPATIPILKEGSATLKIFAGIKDNGIAASRTRYLLYDPHVEQVNLVKGETINISPQVVYNSDVKFSWIEDFENASLSFLYHTNSDTIVNKDNSDVKEGAFSGKVYLDSGMDFFETTSIGFAKSGINSPAYLELDFKTNEPLLIGMYLDNDQFSLVTLNVSTSWKKIYINLSDLINSRTNISQVKIFFGIKSDPNGPFVSANPEIHLDNIKLVHY